MKIIGIGGTNGSGKDTVSQMLSDDYGWLFISASGDLLIPELKRRGEPVERENMAALSSQWRKELGMGAIVDKAVEAYKSTGKKYNGLVVSSLRHPGEADRVHQLGGTVVWVDSDPRIRYERIVSRGQGDKDKKSFEQFLTEEQAEMNHSGGEATLAAAQVKDKADIVLDNNAPNVEMFKQMAQTALRP